MAEQEQREEQELEQQRHEEVTRLNQIDSSSVLISNLQGTRHRGWYQTVF